MSAIETVAQDLLALDEEEQLQLIMWKICVNQEAGLRIC
jgi:hypothetical protein